MRVVIHHDTMVNTVVFVKCLAQQELSSLQHTNIELLQFYLVTSPKQTCAFNKRV